MDVSEAWHEREINLPACIPKKDVETSKRIAISEDSITISSPNE